MNDAVSCGPSSEFAAPIFAICVASGTRAFSLVTPIRCNVSTCAEAMSMPPGSSRAMPLICEAILSNDLPATTLRASMLDNFCSYAAAICCAEPKACLLASRFPVIRVAATPTDARLPATVRDA